MTSTTVTNPDVSHVVTRSTGHLLRLVVGVNAMWLSLSMLSDGLSTLLLPSYLMGSEGPFGPATMLGLATFAGITAGRSFSLCLARSAITCVHSGEGAAC